MNSSPSLFLLSFPESLSIITGLSFTPLHVRAVQRPPSDSCVWGICHVWHPPHPPKWRVKQWLSLFLFPLFINRGLGDSVSVSGRNKCSLSSFTSVPARDVLRAAQRQQCCLLWKTEIGCVSLPVFPSPNRRSLVLTHKCCLIRSSPFYHSISWYLSIYLCLSARRLPVL